MPRNLAPVVRPSLRGSPPSGGGGLPRDRATLGGRQVPRAGLATLATEASEDLRAAAARIAARDAGSGRRRQLGDNRPEDGRNGAR